MQMSLAEEEDRQCKVADSAAMEAPPAPLAAVAASVPASVAASVSTAEAPVVLSMRVLADVTIPDGTVLPAGTQCNKVWLIRNDGTAPWEGVTIVSSGGDELTSGGSSFPVAQAGPGEELEVGISLKVPPVAGRHVSYFRLSSGGKFFGQRLWVDFRVLEDEDDWQVVVPKSAAPAVPEVKPEAVVAVSAAGAAASPTVASDVLVEDVEEGDDDDELKAVKELASTTIIPSAPAFAPAAAPAVEVLSPYAEELSVLRDMGFTDAGQLMPMLHTYVHLNNDRPARMLGLERMIAQLLG